MRPRVAFFSFGSCEGCQLQVLSVEDVLPELLSVVEVVNFREAIDERGDDYDIAFVEGSLVKPDDVAELQQIRGRAKILVAIGACACLGGVNAMRNRRPVTELAREVYEGRQDGVFAALPDASPLRSVVQVNYEIRGCPIDRGEFLEAVRSLVAGTVPVHAAPRGVRGMHAPRHALPAGARGAVPRLGGPRGLQRGVSGLRGAVRGVPRLSRRAELRGPGRGVLPPRPDAQPGGREAPVVQQSPRGT